MLWTTDCEAAIRAAQARKRRTGRDYAVIVEDTLDNGIIAYSLVSTDYLDTVTETDWGCVFRTDA